MLKLQKRIIWTFDFLQISTRFSWNPDRAHPAQTSCPAPAWTSGVVGQADFQAARAGKLAENGGKCIYCTTQVATEVDHIKPLKSFADDVNAGKLTAADAAKKANSKDNLGPACNAIEGQVGSMLRS
jgi:5-methylcytosine-specific restriction endonuclease McrA